MERRTVVIINEQHSLFPEQVELLKEEFGQYAMYTIPKEGITLAEQIKLADELTHDPMDVVFASPVPALLKMLSVKTGIQYGLAIANDEEYNGTIVYIFHNDKREKKELPNGKIISIVAQTGWDIV